MISVFMMWFSFWLNFRSGIGVKGPLDRCGGRASAGQAALTPELKRPTGFLASPVVLVQPLDDFPCHRRFDGRRDHGSVAGRKNTKWTPVKNLTFTGEGAICAPWPELHRHRSLDAFGAEADGGL
jgi:hypothetical protein